MPSDGPADGPDQRSNARCTDRRDVLKAVGAGIAGAATASESALASIETDRTATVGNFSSTPTGNYAVGEFTVILTDAPQIVVTHPENDGVLWATPPGENFLSAAELEVDVEENRGSFTIEEDVRTATADQTIEHVEREDEALVLSGTLSGTRSDTPYELRFTEPSDGHLRFDVSTQNDRFERITIRYASDRGERCYGFGIMPSRLDLAGEEVPVVVQEGGIGRGHPIIDPLMELVASGSSGGPLTTYVSMPYYLSDRGYSLFLENAAYSAFDLTGEDVFEVRALSGRLEGRILAGESPLDRIERFTEYAGRMDQLPDWFHDGAVIGMQGGTERVREVWSELRERDTPISSFWLQDWVGQRDTIIGKQLWWNWERDETRYPGWDELRADMESEDVYLLGYINPYLSDVAEKGTYDRNLYREAIENGYVVEDEDGEPYTVTITDFPSAIVDLSDPEAREWYRDVIEENLLGAGLRGWMADFGEALPFDGELESADPETYHNRYPVEWAKLNREAIEGVGRDDVVFFTRSGFTRSPAYSTLFWEGDQMVTWHEEDGFKSAILGLLTGGISGVSLNHSDSGGYTSIQKWGVGYGREEGLLKRWLEANAFSPVYRTHEGNQPGENVQFYSTGETYDFFARFAKVYAALADYRREVMEEAAEKGHPVVRHPLLHYPDDVRAHRLRYQYMLGEEFMVAPVVEKGATERTVYLPDDKWTHVWSGRTYDARGGRSVRIDAPYGEPPVFYRAGSDAGRQFVENLREYGVLEEPTGNVAEHAGTLEGAGDERAHAYELESADPRGLTVSLSADDGVDVDLYLTLDGRRPSRTDHDRRSNGFGSEETVELRGDELAADRSIGILVRSYHGAGEYELTVVESGLE